MSITQLPTKGELLRVEVTQDDIDNGAPGIPTNCPVARAFRRVFPDASRVGYGGGTIVTIDFLFGQWGNLATVYVRVPDAVREFARRVDLELGELYPFGFEAHAEMVYPPYYGEGGDNANL